MAEESLSPVIAVKPVSIILQVVEGSLSVEDRDRAVQGLWDRLIQLEITPTANMTPLVDSRHSDHHAGLQVLLREPERVSTLVQGVSDRLAEAPVEIRLLIALGQIQVQIQTKYAERLLGLLPALDTLLPARQLFQARAETYALRGGELSPVEQANLELLRHRLNLSPEMAESIIARALGPYLDRQAKLQKYREVLNAELDRQSPLSDTTWAELRKLYQALGLAYEDVAPIDQEYIARIQAEVTRLQQQEEMTRLQEATRLQEEEVQREIEVQQDKADNYRQEFRAAIAKTLYPSEFDRGRLEQARRLWELDPDEVRAIEREVTDERYGPIESKSRLDYSRLRQLLWLNQWEPADQETERLILTALSHDMHPLDGNAILRLNCVDIQTIDALWALYSRRKFGFRAQQQVYLQRDNRADDFLVAVGWQDSVGLGNVNLLTRRKPYRDLQFSLDAPAGHLPTWRWAADTLEGAYVVDEEIVDTVFLHLEKCMPTPGLGTALGTPDGGTR